MKSELRAVSGGCVSECEGDYPAADGAGTEFSAGGLEVLVGDGGAAVSECVRCVLPEMGLVWNGEGASAAAEADGECDALRDDYDGAEVLEFRSKAGFEVEGDYAVAPGEKRAQAGD